MIDALIGILETHGIAGLMLGLLGYIVLSQQQTIKGLHKQMNDTANIFAIKIPAIKETGVSNKKNKPIF